jgi:hypothetical protein
MYLKIHKHEMFLQGPNQNLVGLWALLEFFKSSFLSILTRILVIDNFFVGRADAESAS